MSLVATQNVTSYQSKDVPMGTNNNPCTQARIVECTDSSLAAEPLH